MYSKIPILTLSRNGHKYGCKSLCFRAETELPSDEITKIFLVRDWLLDRSSSRHLRLLHARGVSLCSQVLLVVLAVTGRRRATESCMYWGASMSSRMSLTGSGAHPLL
jgi:hypothetical protein